MKKIKYVTALALCCFALLLAGCSRQAEPEEVELPEPSFETGEPHSNPVAFRLWFETMVSTAGPCTVSVQDAIYDGEQASAWWYAIQEDLNTLNQALGLTEEDYTPFTVYIVEETLNGIQVWNDYLYCTPEDILSGAYRKGLLDVSLTSEPWKQAGLLRSLFDGARTNKKQLAAYLKGTENLDILSLSAACFVDAFATEEDISAALELSQLLCEHVIAEHGGEMLVKDACIACRQELLEELGVKGSYTDPYDGFDSGFRYSSNEDYPLIAETPKGDTFYLQPLWGDMETPDEVRKFLYDACTLPQKILEGVKEASPAFAEYAAQNYSAPLFFYLERQAQAGRTNPPTREIRGWNTLGILCEIPMFLCPSSSYTEFWRFYACQAYLARQYCSTYREFIYDTYFSNPDTIDDVSWSSAGWLEIALKVRELYLSHAPFPQTADEIDFPLYDQAWAAACRFYAPEGYKQQSFAQMYPGLVNPTGGDELTEADAEGFMCYLIETYSLSTFLDYCMDADATFEEIYSVDYETVKAAWLEELINL